MAITQPNASQAPAGKPTNQRNGGGQREQEQAVGWLNLKIKDAAGNEYSIKATIPMHESNMVHQGMLNKIKEDPSHVFAIEGSIAIPSTVVPTF